MAKIEVSTKAVAPKCASASPYVLATRMMPRWGEIGEKEEKKEEEGKRRERLRTTSRAQLKLRDTPKFACEMTLNLMRHRRAVKVKQTNTAQI